MKGRRGLIHRIHAAGIARGCRRHEDAVAPYKRRLLGSLDGYVVEIGPGSGANLFYYSPGIAWTGIEPNLHMHPYLRANAERLGLSIDLRTGTAERTELPDSSADSVVGTLVLCSVSDVAAALAEARRVLRPGGRFVFVEHVAGDPGSWTRRVQRLLRPLWRVAGNGCRPDQDTAALIAAGGFSEVRIERFRAPLPVVGPHIAGVAVR